MVKFTGILSVCVLLALLSTIAHGNDPNNVAIGASITPGDTTLIYPEDLNEDNGMNEWVNPINELDNQIESSYDELDNPNNVAIGAAITPGDTTLIYPEDLNEDNGMNEWVIPIDELDNQIESSYNELDNPNNVAIGAAITPGDTKLIYPEDLNEDNGMNEWVNQIYELDNQIEWSYNGMDESDNVDDMPSPEPRNIELS